MTHNKSTLPQDLVTNDGIDRQNGIVKHLRQVFQIIRSVIEISDILVLSAQGRIQDFF